MILFLKQGWAGGTSDKGGTLWSTRQLVFVSQACAHVGMALEEFAFRLAQFQMVVYAQQGDSLMLELVACRW